MTHFVAYKAVDFRKMEGLLILARDPAYSEQTPIGFTATLGKFSLKISGVDFDYTAGKPVHGFLTAIEAFTDGKPSFTIEMPDLNNPAQDIVYLTSRLKDEGVLSGLDVLFNRLSDDLIEGSRQDDRLLGFGGADVINGNRGDDVLDGGYDDDGQTKGDTLDGGKGRDVLIGGKNGGPEKALPDTFVFSAKARKANADKVKDFAVGDQIHLDSAVFKVLRTDGPLDQALFAHAQHAKDRNDHVIYDEATGKLYYDRDGHGGTSQHLIATFKGKPDISHGDIIVV